MGKVGRTCVSVLSGLLAIMLGHSAQSMHESACNWILDSLGRRCAPWFDVDLVANFTALVFGAAAVGFFGSVIWELVQQRLKARQPRTIAGYSAIQKLCGIAPNSYENIALIISDAARLGSIKAWGRVRPKEALPLHTEAVSVIPPDIWVYGILDAALANGPMPRSDMAYRKQYVKAYLKDDRLLYDAVRFDKEGFDALCREVSISASKRRGIWERLINLPKTILRKVMAVFGIY